MTIECSYQHPGDYSGATPFHTHLSSHALMWQLNNKFSVIDNWTNVQESYSNSIYCSECYLKQFFRWLLLKANTKKHANSSLYNYVDIDIYMVHYKTFCDTNNEIIQLYICQVCTQKHIAHAIFQWWFVLLVCVWGHRMLHLGHCLNIVVSFLHCLGAFWGFLPYMHLFLLQLPLNIKSEALHWRIKAIHWYWQDSQLHIVKAGLRLISP